jgi:hypothetical protein
VALYLVLLGFDVWLLLVLRDVSWPERCALLLQIVGLHTLAFGLVGKTDLGRRFSFLAEDLTSPNLFRFAAANMVLLSVITSAFSVDLRNLLIALPAIALSLLLQAPTFF